MVYVPLAKSAAKRLNGLVPTLDLLNVYAEQTETNPVAGYDLLTRPTLQTLLHFSGAGPCRGIYAHESTYGILSGLYAAVNQELFKVQPNGSYADVGTISGAVLPIQIAFGDTEALVASGDVLQSTDGQTLTPVAFPDDQKVLTVAYLNGYYVASPVGQIAEDGARYLYYSDPLLTPADDGFFTADRRVGAVMTGGPILRIEAVGTELRVHKTDGVEVFQPTGLDDPSDPPFQRVNGRQYDKGTYQPYAIARTKETLVYVDSQGDVCLQAEQPIMISTPAVSERIGTAIAAGQLLQAWAFGWNTREFYVLTVGSATTLVCDLSLTPPLWYEWTDAGGGPWRAAYGVTASTGVVYVGDRVTGDLWTLTEGTAVDQGATAMKQRGTGLLPLTNRQLLTSVSLDCAVGLGGSPQSAVELFTSTDQGQTYDSHGVESLGTTGATMQRMRWARLGQFEPPMVMLAFESDTPVRWRFSNMRANDPF